jgi:bifunctional DNA-binding transcriptional regulator/antitoxin component of YhaV-PrlF toxin-antitoxin module
MLISIFTVIKMFNFGKRQIRAMNYTRQISLPKDWLRFKGIDSGDEVIIELTESGDLLIKPVKGEEAL